MQGNPSEMAGQGLLSPWEGEGLGTLWSSGIPASAFHMCTDTVCLLQPRGWVGPETRVSPGGAVLALPWRSLHSTWWQHAALVARCSSQPHSRHQGLSPTPGRGAGLGRSAEGCRVMFTPWLCAGMCSLLCVLTLAEWVEAQPPVCLESAPHGSVTVSNRRTVALHPQTLDSWANSHSGLSPCSSYPGQAHPCFMRGIVPVLTLS